MYKEFVITSDGDLKSVSLASTTLFLFTISYSNKTCLAGKQIDADHVKLKKGYCHSLWIEYRTFTTTKLHDE